MKKKTVEEKIDVFMILNAKEIGSVVEVDTAKVIANVNDFVLL